MNNWERKYFLSVCRIACFYLMGAHIANYWYYNPNFKNTHCRVLARSNIKAGWWFLDQSIFVVFNIISGHIKENLLKKEGCPPLPPFAALARTLHCMNVVLQTDKLGYTEDRDIFAGKIFRPLNFRVVLFPLPGTPWV